MKVFCRLVRTILQRKITTMMKRFERPGFLSRVSGLLVLGDRRDERSSSTFKVSSGGSVTLII